MEENTTTKGALLGIVDGVEGAARSYFGALRRKIPATKTADHRSGRQTQFPGSKGSRAEMEKHFCRTACKH
jgi:hypothetical protein